MNRSLLCLIGSALACASFTSSAAQSTRPNFTERTTVPLRFEQPRRNNDVPRRRHYDNCCPSRGSLFFNSRPTNNHYSFNGGSQSHCNSGTGYRPYVIPNNNSGGYNPYHQGYSNTPYNTSYATPPYNGHGNTPPVYRPQGGGYRPTTTPVYRPTTTPTVSSGTPYVPPATTPSVPTRPTIPVAPPTYTPPANRPQHGNNGLGNGVDPQPPGNPPVNDGPGTSPGNPGNGNGQGNGNGHRRRASMIYFMKDGTEIPALTTLESGDDLVIKTEDGKMLTLKKTQVRIAREVDDEPIYATR